jgi:hypothetical protein
MCMRIIGQYIIRKKPPCTHCRRRGSGGIAPLILTSAKEVGECQLHFSAVLTPSKRPSYLQNRRLPGHQSTYGPFRQEKKIMYSFEKFVKWTKKRDNIYIYPYDCLVLEAINKNQLNFALAILLSFHQIYFYFFSVENNH